MIVAMIMIMIMAMKRRQNWSTPNVDVFVGIPTRSLERTLEELEIAVDTFHKVAVELEGRCHGRGESWRLDAQFSYQDPVSTCVNNIFSKYGFSLMKSQSMAFTFIIFYTCLQVWSLLFFPQCNSPDATWGGYLTLSRRHPAALQLLLQRAEGLGAEHLVEAALAVREL